MESKQSLDLHARKKLNTGTSVPVLGFGTWELPKKEATNATKFALQHGIRLIDTAAIYGNEEEVGQAIKDSGIDRSEIFVTTKLWNNDQGIDTAKAACAKSLAKLGLDFVDLYLIHYPVPEKRMESWKALKQLQAEGKVKAIGVANFNQAQIEELIAATGVTPAVNQIELHPWHQSSDLVAYCQGKGIVVQAYSPLTRAKMFKDAKLAALAKRYGKSPAQVLIRWSLQRGLVPLPKSANPERITENASVFDFEISKEDMQEMASWDRNERFCVECGDLLQQLLAREHLAKPVFDPAKGAERAAQAQQQEQQQAAQKEAKWGT